MIPIPENLLDEVLGPLPEMPERKWTHYGVKGELVSFCGGKADPVGEPMKAAEAVRDAAICPDCRRVIRQRYGK